MFNLANGVKEDKDHVGEFCQPQDSLVHVKGVAPGEIFLSKVILGVSKSLHVSIHKTGRINKCDKGELFLL